MGRPYLDLLINDFRSLLGKYEDLYKKQVSEIIMRIKENDDIRNEEMLRKLEAIHGI